MDNELLESYSIAVQEQGRKIIELEKRLRMIELALNYHVNNLDTAHTL